MEAPNFESIFECISDGVNKFIVLVLHFSNCSVVFWFISSFHLPGPFQLFLLLTIAIGSIFASSNISSFCNNQLCS